MSKKRNIVLGVCGGIAAYKSCDLVSRLIKTGAEVDVIMTKSATEFVAPLTFEVLSGNRTITDTFNRDFPWEVEHISLAKKADIMVIAPATANIIGKVANGIADDMLSTTIMATRAIVLFVPAMNTQMYENPIVKENIEKLQKRGYIVANTAEGRLACGDFGKGKMIEPSEIITIIDDLLSPINRDLEGKTILVTAGATRENIDPVRFISNYSTGKMGFAIAQAAYKRGAKVNLVTGATSLKCDSGINRIEVISAIAMQEAVDECFEAADIIIKAAAVSDYTPVNVASNKIKKSGDSLTIELKKNPDILFNLGQKKGSKVLIGFAMETQDLIANASAKVTKKNLDFIVANDLKTAGAGFGTDTNIVSIIDKNGVVEKLPIMSKADLANIILDKAINISNK